MLRQEGSSVSSLTGDACWGRADSGMWGGICPFFPDLAAPPPLSALCPDRPLPAKKVTQEDVRVMLNLLEEVCAASLPEPAQASARPPH